MNDDNAIPAEPLDLIYTNSGFLPHVALHQKGPIFLQESSRADFWLFGVMLLLAVGALLLPWNQRGLLNLRVKHFVAIGCLWGGICGLLPYFIRNRYGQNVTIDPAKETIRIQQRGLTVPLPTATTKITLPMKDVTILWSEVLALQICYQGGVPHSGYQLNLIRKHDGTVERYCLLKHTFRAYVAHLATRYQRAFGFKIVDHSRGRQQTVAGYGSQARRT